MNRDEFLKKVISFNEEIHRESYQHLIGLKEELDETSIYAKYKDIFTKINIEELKKETPSSSLEKRKNNHLLGFLIGNYMGNKLSKLSDEAAVFEAKAIVDFKGSKIAYRQLRKLITEQENKENRDLVYQVEKPVKKKLLWYSIKMLKTELKLIKDLGYKGYIDLTSSLKEVDYFKLMQELKPFLVETDLKYTELMGGALKTINVDLENATNYDYLYYSRQRRFDRYFPKEKVVDVLKKTLIGMDFDLEKQKNIELDIEEREKKVPRAFMMHIRIPEEIKLVIKPNGGHEDYNAILHEAGHAEHYAHVNPKLDYELKHFGDHAVSEVFSFLFDNLMQDSNWLKNYTKMNKEEIKDFVDYAYLGDLYMFRRYISKLIYELKLFSNDLRILDENFNPTKKKYKNFGECYSDILTKATKVRFPTNSYLLDLDSGFYVADYLRAWVMERQLRFKLKQQFGVEWFKNKKAGEFLRKLYWHGNSKNIYEMAKEVGYENLDTSYIFKDFKDFLNNI